MQNDRVVKYKDQIIVDLRVRAYKLNEGRLTCSVPSEIIQALTLNRKPARDSSKRKKMVYLGEKKELLPRTCSRGEPFCKSPAQRGNSFLERSVELLEPRGSSCGALPAMEQFAPPTGLPHSGPG